MGNKRVISLGVGGVLILLELDLDPRPGKTADIHVGRHTREGHRTLACQVHGTAHSAAETDQAVGRLLRRDKGGGEASPCGDVEVLTQ
jgi:hypothetical protein